MAARTTTTTTTTATAAWDELGELGGRRDLTGLAQAFAAGSLPPRDLEGPGAHDLVVSCIHPLIDLPLRAIVARLPRPLPWLGKSFHPAERRGVNDFHPLLGPLLRATAPLSGWERGPSGPQGLGFDTYVEAGAVEPSPRVLVIDYPIPGRPIRDEMVAVSPGVYLGRALLRLPTDTYVLAAYWRLRTDTTGAR